MANVSLNLEMAGEQINKQSKSILVYGQYHAYPNANPCPCEAASSLFNHAFLRCFLVWVGGGLSTIHASCPRPLAHYPLHCLRV